MRRSIPFEIPFRFSRSVLLLSSTMACVSGYIVPPMADVQSARTTEDGEYRIVPFASSFSRTDWGDGGRLADVFGVLLGAGVSSNTELQLRCERIRFPGDGDGHNFTSFGTKYAAVEDVVALVLPIGLYLGGGVAAIETIQLHPGVIVSAPVNDYLEINTAGRLVFPLNTDLQKRGIISLGLGLSNDASRWAILPEVGVAWNLGEGEVDPLINYGVAVAFYLK